MKRRYVANLKFPTLFFFPLIGKKRVSVRLVLESVQVPTIVKIAKEVELKKERKKKREDQSGYLR